MNRISHILANPREDWERIRRQADGNRRYAFRKLDVDWEVYNTKDYLFTHDTACCSVETEENGYWIKPACWELVNANGNAWTNPVLLGSFRTFVGGDNFLEHCFAKGTRVLMADGTYKNIEDMQAGDKVINHLGEEDAVMNLQIRESNDLYELNCDNSKLIVTGNHPIYAYSKGEPMWKRIDELDPATDKIIKMLSNSKYSADFELNKIAGATLQKVYNIEVEKEHSYIAEGVVVHNCQIPALSKGKILDAIIRPVHYHSEKENADADIWYVDLLIATSRKHTSLIEKIESGQLKTLSMGCGKADCPINMADGTIKNIIDVKVGDKVYTHKGNIREVTRCFEFNVASIPLYRLHYQDGAIELTGEHPVLVKQDDGSLKFIEISNVKIGDILIKPKCDGTEEYNEYPILSIDKESYDGKVYNLSVKDDNSYLVNGIAVHNCIANTTQCSICGRIIHDGEQNCEHLDRHIGQMVTCADGVPRICAELCGNTDENGQYEEGSVEFIEQSWVQQPAFKGSVINSFIETDEIRKAREDSKDELSKLFEGNLFTRLKVADVESNIALKIAREQARLDQISKRIADSEK